MKKDLVKTAERQRDEALMRLKQEVDKKMRISHSFGDDKIRFGVVSDTHIGSLYDRFDLLKTTYRVFQKQGIQNVYHCGDFCDGEKMFKGHEREIYAQGSDAQVRLVVNQYPEIKGITTYFILGSHDLSFYKASGTDIGISIMGKRHDLIYLGQEEADIWIGGKNRALMRLSHPGKGSA